MIIQMVTEKYMVYTVFSKESLYLEEEEFYKQYGTEESYEVYLENYNQTTKRFETSFSAKIF